MDAQSKPLMFTKTETRIIKLLSDGMPHERREMLECLLDVQARYINLQNHVVRLRQKLRTRNEEIVCELRKGSIYYRHVKLLKPLVPSDDPIS